MRSHGRNPPMFAQLTRRFMTEPDKRLLFKFMYNFGWQGGRAIRRYEKRLKRGECFPAFLFMSVTDRCNLNCRGCWVTATKPGRELDRETINRLVDTCRDQGSKFFGIMGGEPLLYRGLMDVFAAHPDCYFLLFTNGTLITDEVVADLKRVGNVTPLVSIEGLETVSDERRGGTDVYRRSMEGIERCRRNGLITGVATSVCSNNIDDLASETFLRKLIDMGVLYVWYYIYRPVGPDPSPELALSQEQITRLRKFLVDVRCKVPILVVDAYWDHLGRALCPAAVGIGHHIGPGGDIELCPPIQFAAENVGDGSHVDEVIKESKFLRDFGSAVLPVTHGCVLLDDPELLKTYVSKHGAKDTSGRESAVAELDGMACRCSHYVAGAEIPERHWMYRFAKKNWFFGFGAYG